jgi:serine protease AprX
MSRNFYLPTTIRVVFAALVAVALLIAPVPAVHASAGQTVTVIVQKAESAGTEPEELVERLGGKVEYDLSIINGFAATVDESDLELLASSPGVLHATEDAPVQMQGLLGDALGGLTGYSEPVDNDMTSTKSVSEVAEPTSSDGVGTLLRSDSQVATATDESGTESEQPAAEEPQAERPEENFFYDSINVEEAHEAGATGEGTTVALIDTGVADLPDVSDDLVDVRAPNGTVQPCVNLSGEDHCSDSYGHGTFLAGLITGNGKASGGKYVGVAPDAEVLSVKIAGRDGSASVGKILYAIQWVTNHKDQYGIDVLNLALGTDSTQSYRYDPLNYAVQRAWKSGVSVVVSAGNRGPDARTISKPADDPYVITTGSVDDMATADLGDDALPNFSSKGPTAADGLSKPDLTAPGARVISLRSPGSAIEEQFPGGGVDNTYRRGSGTSQSAAIVSGAAALLKSAHPELSPNQVKYALTNSTNKAASEDPNAVGAGVIDIGSAVTDLPVGEANQNIAPGRGSGALERSQGSIRLLAKDRGHLLGRLRAVVPIRGEDSGNPTGGSWYETGWQGGSWYGGSWYGGSWYGGSWYGGSWYGGSWYGGSWYGGSWYGAWD